MHKLVNIIVKALRIAKYVVTALPVQGKTGIWVKLQNGKALRVCTVLQNGKLYINGKLFTNSIAKRIGKPASNTKFVPCNKLQVSKLVQAVNKYNKRG